jgi:SAM-dependent methyltransferase
MTAGEAGNAGADLYASYDGWKGWKQPFDCDAATADYFEAELAGWPITGKRVLEIGFGNGEFLAWARSKGAEVIGAEITPAAIAAAQKHGIALIDPDFENSGSAATGSYDLIAAFDVFEHLYPDTIIAKLRAIDAMLAPGGRLILRYPNGQSPFGLASQHGDATHLTALSRAKMEQYATGTQLVTLRYGGVARPPARSLPKRFVRTFRYALRDIHMKIIRFLYATDVELEPVVTHVLERPSGEGTA